MMRGNKGKDKATSQATTGKKKKNRGGGSSSAPPPPPPLVDRTGYLSIECPYPRNPDIRYEVRDGCEESCPDYSVVLNSFGNFHISTTSQQGEATYCLDNARYESTLEGWLAGNPIWDIDNTRYHTNIANRGWNLYRPTKGCTMLIRGIIKAVLDFHAKERNGHGNLNPRNILFQQVVEREVGQTSNRILVKLINPTRNSCLVRSDINRLNRIIFTNILAPENGENIPPIWEDLKDMLQTYMGRDEDDRQIILDHPATWECQRRSDYFERLWLRTQQDPNYRHSDLQLGQHGRIRGVIENVVVDGSWWNRVPKNTPLSRFFVTQDYRDTSFDLYKDYRNVLMHLRELNYDYHNRVFVYIEPHEPLYEENKFVEAVLMECFPNFLLNIYKSISPNLCSQFRAICI